MLKLSEKDKREYVETFRKMGRQAQSDELKHQIARLHINVEYDQVVDKQEINERIAGLDQRLAVEQGGTERGGNEKKKEKRRGWS